MAEVHELLKAALRDVRHLEKVQDHYGDLQGRLEKERAYLQKLEANLDKEQRDVERLESTSLHALFRRVLGDRKKELERERQEYLHAALLYNDGRKSVELIEYEMNLLLPKISMLEEARAKLTELKSVREEQLLAEDSAIGSKLRELYDRADQCNARIKEVDEAIEAGQVVLKLLISQEKELVSARNWGQWDMFTNGTGWIKHSAVDRARELLHKVRHALLRFEKEIEDVYDKPLFDIDLRIERIDSFVDIFFDNLITDWVVQKKIKNALDNSRNTIYQVESALRKLSEEAHTINTELDEIETHRKKIVTGA